MLTVAIIEDEALARQRIRTLLEEIDDVRLVGEAASVEDAVRLLETVRPDVALLDVQLLDGAGFDVIQRVSEDVLPRLIFVTAFDQHALHAFDVAAVDYVLKPVHPERLREAIDRARELERPKPPVTAVRASRIAVTKEDDAVVLLDVTDIEYIEAAGNYVRIHWQYGHQLFRESIGALEERLDAAQFARVHRSVIVNLDCVEHLDPNAFGDYRVTLRSGAVVPLSRRYRDRIPLLVGRL